MNGKYQKYVRQNRKKIGIAFVILIILIALSIAILPAKLFRTSSTLSNTTRLSNTTTSSNAPKLSNKTIYVAADGSGDFNCDGSDDQVEINQALEYAAENPQFTTVHLKGPSTYIISDSILIGNNTVFEGDPTAVIKLEDKADWPSNKPLITQMGSSNVHGVTVRGFEINGDHDKNEDRRNGEGYYTMICFIWSKDIQVHDMYLHDGNGDGLRVEGSSNVQFYNNRVYKLGHDGFYAINTDNVEAWNNNITCRTNSGLRARDSNHVKFHDNVIDSFYNWSAGGPGIQIEKSNGIVNDVEVYNNTIHDTYGPGIWLIGYGKPYPREEAQNVRIHHNIFYNTGTNPSIDWVGGIVTSGFYDTLIENNVFDSVYHAAIVYMQPTVSTGTDSANDLSAQGNGYTTIVRNNIIVNTRKRTKDPQGTGYGIINYLPETSSFVLENNCLYNNTGGNYLNATSKTDIYADPLFADQANHDYHLKSNSPCIGAGYYSSDSAKEAESTDKINIGRYS